MESEPQHRAGQSEAPGQAGAAAAVQSNFVSVIIMQAEMKILKLEGENAAQRAVLRRREEEKAAVQRRTRDVALLSAAAGVIVVVQADNNAHCCPCS